MRVVIASDGVAGLSPTEASERIAGAFAERGVTVAVVPMAAAGDALRQSIARCAPEFEVVAVDTSERLGAALAGEADALLLDLTETSCRDLGRGALGGDPAETFEGLRRRWQGRSLVALVPEGQVARELTGLAGYASTELRAEGADLATVLAADAAAERWAAELGVVPQPGAGAARGLGLIVQALGGRVMDPLTFLSERFRLASTIARADLVVTGAEALDFHALGGPVVKRVAAMAGEALRPVIGIVGRNFVSSRELRLAGFEAAYPILSGIGDDQAQPDRLSEVSAHVARTWHW